MAVRDHLPVNGAGAYNIPDPQAREPAVITHCAHCDEPLYLGDEVVRDESGKWFCDEECYFHWLIREGLASVVVLSPHGNIVVRGMR